MSSHRLPAWRLTLLAAAVLCVGCSVSVHAEYGDPQAERAYRQAIIQPFNDLTSAASKASQTCAGGSQPSPKQCYVDTNIEIVRARALERVLRSVPTPSRFAKANTGLLQGLGIFVQGLIKRNDGLVARSTAEYVAGENLITNGLAVQKKAITEYPSDANIRL